MSLAQINKKIHAYSSQELSDNLSTVLDDIRDILNLGRSSDEQYYKNHTGRELFRKLFNFGLTTELNDIGDGYDVGFRPDTIAGLLSSGSVANLLTEASEFILTENSEYIIIDQGSGGSESDELTNTYSVDFDGSNDFMAADGAASAASSFNGGTWQVWIAPDDASPNTYQTIISFGDDDADSFIQISIGGITQTIITASCTLGGTQQWVIITNDLAWSATDWHHVAIVHNGTDATLYIDGVASGFYTLSTNKAIWHNDIAGLDKFTVGAKIANGSIGQYFNGNIDEVAVCETQLTAANLLEIANPTTAKATDLSSYSPVGWWRMGDNDGGSGTTITDQGSGENDGTLTNGPAFSNDVPAAAPSDFTNTYSVNFDGTNDYISIADSPDLSFGDSVNDSPFSISCRVKLNTGFANTGLAGKINSTHIEYAINIIQATKKPFFKIYDGSIGTGRGWIFDTVLSEDVLYHLVFTYDGRGGTGAANGMKCYLDGVELTAKTASNNGTYVAMHNQSAPLVIGGFSDYSQFFDGKVDEFAIFNTELSAVQVDAIYNAGVPDDLAFYSPVGWWRMGDNDGGTGTTVTDQGSGGNDGSLINGAAFISNTP